MLPDSVLGASVRAGAVDVRIDAPVIDQRGRGRRVTLVADARSAQLDVDGIARFAIVDGAAVTVDAGPGSSTADVVAWLHGSVAALVSGQQGRFALHASTVAVDGEGIALTGARRAGKSTTSLELRRRGHELVADDVSVVDLGDGAVVSPFGRALHIDEETAAKLEIAVPVDAPVLSASGKRVVPAPLPRPVRLGTVVLLLPADVEDVGVERVAGAPAVGVLAEQAYRGELLGRLWPDQLFAWATQLASTVAVVVVRRPLFSWSVSAVADVVERQVGGRVR